MMTGVFVVLFSTEINLHGIFIQTANVCFPLNHAPGLEVSTLESLYVLCIKLEKSLILIKSSCELMYYFLKKKIHM